MTTQPDLSRALAIVAMRWKTVALCVALVMGAAFLYTSTATPIYEATAQVGYSVPDRTTNPTNGFAPTSDTNRQNMETLQSAAQGSDVLAQAAGKAHVATQQAQRDLAVRVHGDAAVLDFVARSSDPALATRLANSYADAFVANRRAGIAAAIGAQLSDTRAQLAALGKPVVNDPYLASRAQLQQQLAQQREALHMWSGSIAVANAAQHPQSPVWPRSLLTMLAALVVGLGLGCGAALLLASVDRKLRPSHIDELPAPALVKVPFAQQAPRTMPLGPNAADPLVADAFAALGARVMLDRRGERGHVVLVTSARASEGKSTVCANLAASLAQGGRRVVLVDADMRRPTQDVVFPALQGRGGLSQVLAGGVEIEQVLALVAPNLAAVSSGPRQSNASVLLASVAFRSLLDRLARISDVVVIDAPPVLAVNDALAIASAADQVLVCARMGHSQVGEIGDAHAKLAAASATPQALVLVGTERPAGYGYDSELSVHAALPPLAEHSLPAGTSVIDIEAPAATSVA